MNEWLQALLLALIQGVSEFLPISSSAHLVLPSLLLGWPDQGLAFDIAVHAGTLLAVLFYFREDLWVLVTQWLPGAQSPSGDVQEVWKLGLATLPAVLVGLLFSSLIEAHLRGLGVIATTTLLFGLLLAWAARDWRHARVATHEPVRWRDALVIGLAQTLALIPGTSRSGITITAALLLGYHPATAARFSFLMSIPVIAGALLFMLLDESAFAAGGLAMAPTLIAAAIAFLSAWATIALFMRLIAAVGLMPFAIYRVLLAGGLFFILFLRG
jgi:undecaprenyl-diphosphatase